MHRTLLAVCVFLVVCGPAASVRDVSREDAVPIVESGSALVLDVRTPAEFATGHVPGAVNVPHTDIEARVAELASHRDGDVIVYCERGPRATAAAEALAASGFTSVRHLDGDMAGWRDAGLPVER